MKKDPRIDPAAKKIAQARAWLLREHLWLGAMALRLEPDESDNPKVTFMATDGVTLLYNRKRVIAEGIENIAGVLSHETAHCALGHFARRGDRDQETFNIAGDHAANLLLQDAGITLPQGALADPKYTGWTVERIYIDLQNNPPSDDDKKKAQDGQVNDAPPDAPPDAPQDGQDGQGDAPGKAPDDGQGDDQGDQDAPQDAPSNQATAQKLAQDWQQAAAEAQHIATARGQMPAALKASIEAARAVPQNWKALLEQFASDPTKTDYRWSPPNRRHLWRGVILPALRGEELGTMVLSIDTSGSVYGRASEFVQHGRDMLESGIIGELVIIACDAQAHLIGRYRRGEEITIPELPGGGGTSFRPPFDLITREGISPTCHAYLTDLEGDFPDDDPGYPVLWVATQPGRAPFGTVVDMTE
jgi:predicted metal-dependent peptidase